MVAATTFAASPEIERAVADLAAAPDDVRENVERFTDAYMNQAWLDEVRASPASPVQQRVLVDTSKAYTFAAGFQVRSGSSSTPLRGGLVPNVWARSFEFGTNWRGSYRNAGFLQRSRGGRIYEVKNKRTQSPLPRRANEGHIFYPAVTRIGKRAGHLFAQTIFRALADAVDGSPHGS
jgi:hypothetical protein